MSTNPAEFQRFINAIPEDLHNKLYFIPLKILDKGPDVPEKESWKDPIYRLTITEAKKRLERKGNVGFVAQPETLLVIDLDNMEKWAPPKPTMEIITSSGKRHYYYTNQGIKNKDWNEGKTHILEIRAEWRYVVAPGSYVPPDPRQALSEGTGLYRLGNDLPIATLTPKDLPENLQPEEKRQTDLTTGGTWRNKYGWSIQQIRARDQKLDTLLNNDNTNYPSASEADMATVAKLKWWDYDDGEAVDILKAFRPREKLDRQDYIVSTLEKISDGATISDVVDTDIWKPDGGYGKIEDFIKITEEKTQELSKLKPDTLENLHELNKKWLEITDKDKEYIEVMYAAAIDRTLVGDPIWIYAIAPSGGMKTTIARSLQKYPRIYSLDKITPATLISGLSKKDKETGNPIPAAGLLQYLNGKTLVIKDFTTMLSMPNDMRNEIYGQLRSIYDGYYEAGFGSLPQPIRVRADIGLILCVTPVIDKYTQAHTSLGERLLKIRQHPDPVKTTAKSIQNLGKEPEMRFELQNAVSYYLQTLDTENIPEISKQYLDDIAKIARLTALGRSHVYCDYYQGKIVTIEPTEPEIPTRLVKQLRKLAILLAIVRKRRSVTVNEMCSVLRVALDTFHPERYAILKTIYESEEPLTSGAIASASELHPQTCFNTLQQMKIVKLVYEKNVDVKTCYFITDNIKKIYEYLQNTYSTNSSNGITGFKKEVYKNITPLTPSLLLVDRSLKDDLSHLIRVLTELNHEAGEAVSREILINKCRFLPDYFDKVLSVAMKDGAIFSPRPGYYRAAV